MSHQKGKKKKEDGPSNNSTLALNQLGPLASIYVKDAEVKEWKVMSMEEATKASI